MDLRALRYFLCVVEARSFSKAAAFLRVAQPALSRQVRKLEEELGMPLLIRSGRGLELTEAGALMLQRGQSLLQQAGQMIEDVKAQASALSGSVTVGATLATGQRLAPPLLQYCDQHCPNVSVNLVEGFSSYIYDRFLRNELTVCLLHNPPAHEGVLMEPLMTERLYLIGPPLSDKRSRPLDGKAWHSYPLVIPSWNHSIRMLIEQTAEQQSVSLDVRYVVDGLGMTSEIIRAGLAYAILARSVAEKLMESGLQAVELPNSSASWVLTLTSRIDQKSARPVQAVREAIRTVVASIPGDHSQIVPFTSAGQPVKGKTNRRG